jgi:bacteriocin-like protein
MKNYKKLNDAELNNVTGGGENMDISVPNVLSTSVPNVLNTLLQKFIDDGATMKFTISQLQMMFPQDYDPDYIAAYVQSHWPKT